MSTPLSSTETLAWLLTLPAAAECFASVWLPDWSLGGVDVQLLFLNVSGAMLEGMFSAWEGGRANAPPGAVGAGVASMSGVMRSAFIAAYTSWAGMVTFAAGGTETLAGAFAYLSVTTVLGVVAHAIGGALAGAIGAKQPSSATKAATAVRQALLAATVALIVASVLAVRAGLGDYDDEFYGFGEHEDLPALVTFFDAEYMRLGVGMACAVAGVLVGNAAGAAIENAAGAGGAVANGTLGCNAAFCLASLVLPLATLRRKRWGRSVVLQSFAGSFCGAATAFGGWMDDSVGRWRDGSTTAAVANLLANLAVASALLGLVCVCNHLLLNKSAIDTNSNGVVEAHELTGYLVTTPLAQADGLSLSLLVVFGGGGVLSLLAGR